MNFLFAIMVGFAVSLFRLIPEWMLINSVIDAQGGLSLGYALVVAALVFVVASCFAFLAFALKGQIRQVSAAALVLLISYTAYKDYRFYTIHTALTRAENPHESPQVLQSLYGLKTLYFGYELDNRLAANPSSPEGLLRALHGKEGQVGTQAFLARNPRTPKDILNELSKSEDKSTRKGAEMNPSYIRVERNGIGSP
jgi:hypothetical protein